MTAPLDLDKIEARAAAATPGPWKTSVIVDTDTVDVGPEAERVDGWLVAGVDAVANVAGDTLADARFIAAARTDVPALVARVRELEAGEFLETFK